MISKKVVLIGDYVGKSSIIERYRNNNYGSTRNPLNLDMDISISEITINDVVIEFWQIRNKDLFNFNQDLYLKDANVIVLLHDITNEKSYYKMSENIETIKKIDLIEKPILLVGTKLDRDNEREIPYSKIIKLASSIKSKYIEVSAKNDINISELFTLILDMISDYDSECEYDSDNMEVKHYNLLERKISHCCPIL